MEAGACVSDLEDLENEDDKKSELSLGREENEMDRFQQLIREQQTPRKQIILKICLI